MKNITLKNIVIFEISCRTGEGINAVKKYLLERVKEKGGK